MRSSTDVSIVLPHSADAVWDAIADFGDYRWGEGVSTAEIDGAANAPGTIRRFRYYDQPSAQRLVAYDAAERSMAWESVEPFDATLSYYRASMRVLPITVGEQCVVIWSVALDTDEASAEQWGANQRREFRKSLERLSLYVSWAQRGDLD